MNYKLKTAIIGGIGTIIAGVLFYLVISSASKIGSDAYTFYFLIGFAYFVFQFFNIGLCLEKMTKEKLMKEENRYDMEIVHISRENGCVTNLLLKHNFGNGDHYFFASYEDPSGYTTDDLVKEIKSHNCYTIPVYLIQPKLSKFYIDIDTFIKNATLSIVMELIGSGDSKTQETYKEYPNNIKDVSKN